MRTRILLALLTIGGMAQAAAEQTSTSKEKLHAGNGYTINLEDPDKAYCMPAVLPFYSMLATLENSVGASNIVVRWLHDDDTDGPTAKIHVILAKGRAFAVFVYAPSMKACEARKEWAVSYYKVINGF
jgi:hypothetical protein